MICCVCVCVGICYGRCCVCNADDDGVCIIILFPLLPSMLQQLPNLHEEQRDLDPGRSENSVFL